MPKPERSRFRALHRLWKHPLGEVSGGTDASTGARISVTALHPGSVVTDTIIESARATARVAASLSSPAVIKPIDVQRMPDGRIAIATEPFEGTPLTNISRNQPMPVVRTIAILRQVCKVLADAHEVGLVHRALSLGSVIIRARTDRPDTVAVTDFALGALLDGDVAVLKEDASLQPVTPERISGQQLDVREDIYLLGCIAYTLITGGPPFRTGTSDAVRRRHAIEDPMPILDRLRGARNVPAGLATWVHRCLAKEPDDRYADAAETEAALCIAQIEAHIQTPWDDLPAPDVERDVALRITTALSPQAAPLPPELDDDVTVLRAPSHDVDATVKRVSPSDDPTRLRATTPSAPRLAAPKITLTPAPPPPAPEPEPEPMETIDDAPSTSIVLETFGDGDIDRSPTVVTQAEETLARADGFADEQAIAEDDEDDRQHLEALATDSGRERDETVVGTPPSEDTVSGHAPVGVASHDITIRGPAPTAASPSTRERNDATFTGPAPEPSPPLGERRMVALDVPDLSPLDLPDPIDRTLVAPPDPIDRTLDAAPEPGDRTLVTPVPTAAAQRSAEAFEDVPTTARGIDVAPSSRPTVPGATEAPRSSTPTLPAKHEPAITPTPVAATEPEPAPAPEPEPTPEPSLILELEPEPSLVTPIAAAPPRVAPPMPVAAPPMPVASPPMPVAAAPAPVAAPPANPPTFVPPASALATPSLLPAHAAPPWPSNPSGLTGQYPTTSAAYSSTELDSSMIASIGEGRRNLWIGAIVVGVAALVVTAVMIARPSEPTKPAVAATDGTGSDAPTTIRASEKPSADPAADIAATPNDLASSGDRARADGRAADAEALYQRAIVREPQHLGALLGLGELRLAAGDLPKAAGYFRRAVGAAPKNGAARIALGDVLVKQGELGEAKKQFRKAKSLGHPDANARLATP